MNKRTFGFLLVAPLLLSSCDGQSSLSSFDDNKTNEIITKYSITLNDFFDVDKNNYAVYYYSENCPNCKNTLPYVLTYIEKIENNEDLQLDSIYFLDATKDPINRFHVDNVDFTTLKRLFKDNVIGAKNSAELYQIGYPLLYTVSNIDGINQVDNIYIGEKEITTYIKDTR